MSDDLISRKETMEVFEKWLRLNNPDEEEMVALSDIGVSALMTLEEMDTAYDVDKVVEELKGMMHQ